MEYPVEDHKAIHGFKKTSFSICKSSRMLAQKTDSTIILAVEPNKKKILLESIVQKFSEL